MRKKLEKKSSGALIDTITNDQAHSILKTLWEKSHELKKQIKIEFDALVNAVHHEEICEDVTSALEGLSSGDLFDRSGPSSHGYHDPSEMAYTMMEEAVAPFQEQMNRLFELGKNEQAIEYCKGIVKALHDYDKENDSEFSEYATDCAAEMAGWILKDCLKKIPKKEDRRSLEKYLDMECS